MATRQEIYDRIRQSSKDQYIVEEMIRLGFWPRDTGLPSDPVEELKRREQLQSQLRSLTSENARLHNAEALKREARKRRMLESRRKRQETKERRLREREERAEAWQQRKSREILYLGEGVSAGLGHKECDETKLKSLGLPIFREVTDLAAAMEISVGQLRFLSFSRRCSTVSHYRRFAIPKKTGGLRSISAPMPRLKQAQEWILINILEKIELHRCAHGFRRNRSIVSNAKPHVGADVIINVDIKDFFPTVTYLRIRGLFRSFGYSELISTIFALLCSEPDVSEVKLDQKQYFVARSERYLPQGAPSSPALTNIICRGLDARLSRTAEKLGFLFTRYADDITFSASDVESASIGRALRQIDYIVQEEGFKLHPEKTRVLRSSRRQEVTGLVVNEKVSVPRSTLRRFRAVLFQIEKDGPAGKKWGASSDVLESIEGFANFVAMVDSEKGEVLQTRVKAILKKFRRN